MVEAGPLNARLLLLGEQHMEDAKQRFFSEHEHTDQPIILRPSARLLVLRKAAMYSSL